MMFVFRNENSRIVENPVIMDKLKIKVVDMHTGGEPVRIVESGYPEIVGDTILSKRDFVKENLDHIRKFVMYEPRGHYDMYGVIPVKPDIPKADAAFLFMHNKGYSTMCGHAVISLGRYCIDEGIVKYKEPEAEVNIQCPCGLVKVYVTCIDGRTDAVRFRSVPAFVVKTDLEMHLEKLGNFKVDVVYGGAFYVFVDVDALGIDFSNIAVIRSLCAKIKAKAIKEIKVSHPDDSRLDFIYGVIFTKNQSGTSVEPIPLLCAFADSQIDRSPCGSGTTAKMALLYHKGIVSMQESRVFENPLTHSLFKAKVVETTSCGDHKAVVVEVKGNGYYMGRTSFIAEKQDMQRHGFLIK